MLKTAELYLRHGVGVSIRGSHPRDPGSIPGAGIHFDINCFEEWIEIRNHAFLAWEM